MKSEREALLAFLKVLDGHLLERNAATKIYLSGGAAVVLAYGRSRSSRRKARPTSFSP